MKFLLDDDVEFEKNQFEFYKNKVHSKRSFLLPEVIALR